MVKELITMDMPIESVYHDYKLVADSIVDNESFQKADTGILLSNLYDVVKALEKQMPMKPKVVEVDMEGMDMETGEEYIYKIDEAHCCNCNFVIGCEYDRFDEHYCSKCGQKIDWSEWEDE